MVVAGLDLPPKRIVGILSLAGMLKEGAHFDVLIALGLSGDAVACIGWMIALYRIPCQRRNINAR